MNRLNRLVRFALLVPLLALAACLNDAPSGTHPSLATLGITAQISGEEAPLTVDVQVYADSFVDLTGRAARVSALEQPSGTVQIGSGHFTLAQGQHRLPVTVNLGQCLGLQPGSETDPRCVVRVGLQLTSGGVIVDSLTTDRFTIRPGQPAETPEIQLVGGHVAPAIDSVGQAVAVDFSMVRYELGAHDKNHDLLNVEGTVIDTAGGIDGDGLTQVGPTSNVTGIFYAPLRAGFRPQTLEARAFDATGDSAEVVTHPITLPAQDALSACCMTSTVNATTVDVSVNVFNRSELPASGELELLFKNVNSDYVFPDTIYFGCFVPLNTQGVTSASCQKEFNFDEARIIAIPVDDAGNPGFAASCTAGSNCNNFDNFSRSPLGTARPGRGAVLRSPSIFRALPRGSHVTVRDSNHQRR
jgi:hypothetical protein